MSNSISAQLLAQLYAQESNDPFLMLVTISHGSFSTIRLVNNLVNVTSRGNTYTGFPMTVRLPQDDGESNREVQIDFDNVSLELVDELRSVTTPMDVKVEMVLASSPDDVQLSLEELKVRTLTYDKMRISARLVMDSFLNVEMTSEKYTPTNFPGLF